MIRTKQVNPEAVLPPDNGARAPDPDDEVIAGVAAGKLLQGSIRAGELRKEEGLNLLSFHRDNTIHTCLSQVLICSFFRTLIETRILIMRNAENKSLSK